MRLAGAVLTGGRSSRMGRDKALVEVDGTPMARRVADALASVGCAPVIAAGGDPAELEPLGLRVVPDADPVGQGPAVGVQAALDHLADRADAVLVAPCDVPGLSATVLGPLVEAFRANPSGPRPDVVAARTSRLEPAIAVWSTRCRGHVAAEIRAGTRALHRLLVGLEVVEVPVAGPLVNVNAPDDLPG